MKEGAGRYRGKEPFQMINGGDDDYHEYGFVQVVCGEYMDSQERMITLEIYEMVNSSTAYGIHTFKTVDSGSGKSLPVGQDALLQEYYFNFWKGILLVTIAGLDIDDVTLRGVIALATAVDHKIHRSGEKPELAKQCLSGKI